MEGAYSFGEDGMAEILSAPAWSRYALEQVQSQLTRLANAADDPTLSDADFQRIVEDVEQRIALRDERVAQLVADKVEAKPRMTVARFCLQLVAVLAAMSGAVAGGQLTYDAVERILHEVFG